MNNNTTLNCSQNVFGFVKSVRYSTSQPTTSFSPLSSLSSRSSLRQVPTKQIFNKSIVYRVSVTCANKNGEKISNTSVYNVIERSWGDGVSVPTQCTRSNCKTAVQTVYFLCRITVYCLSFSFLNPTKGFFLKIVSFSGKPAHLHLSVTYTYGVHIQSILF